MDIRVKSIRVGVAVSGLLFQDMHFAANNMLKLNDKINICLINLNIILYHVFSLNICEYANIVNIKNIIISKKITHISI